MADYYHSNYTSLFGNAFSLSMTPDPNTYPLVSPLTKQEQIIARPGGRWMLQAEWRPKTDAERREIQALLTLLNGAEHYFNTSPFHVSGESARGAWSGTPVVDGASNSGKTLGVRGAPINVTDYAMAGDYFRLGTQLFMVTDTADSDGSGEMTLSIWPDLRATPADGAALDEDQQCRFRLFETGGFPYSSDTELAGGGFTSSITATFRDAGSP